MKTTTHKLFIRILCVVLSVVMTAVLCLNAFADDGKAAEKLYIKDVKLIYAENETEAKTYVPEGYVFMGHNINEGTDGSNVYLAYSTTADESEAATDIKMMNMKGGFVLSDYEDQMRDISDNVKKVANDVKISAELFAKKYKDGTNGAKAAYRALSFFTVDEADGQNLADYLLYGNPSEKFYIKLVLNAHQNIISAIISALTMAVQGDIGDTWIDRLEKLETPTSVVEEPNFWDDSGAIWDQFYEFYKVYKTIDHGIYDGKADPDGNKNSDNKPTEDPGIAPDEQPEIENNGTEALYEYAYRILDERKFGDGTKLSSWLLGDDVFIKNLEKFENYYCMLAVLTPEELAMMRLCGPLYMIVATGMDDESYEEYIDMLSEVTENETSCSVWAGVNNELFRSSIGITDKAARAIAEAEFERELNNVGDSTAMTGLRTAGLIAACGVATLGVGILAIKICAVPIVMSIFGSLLLPLGVGALVVAAVVAIVYLIVWAVEVYRENHPVYTEIPEYMYDYVEDDGGNMQFILYKGVTFQDGKVADVNTWKGKEWHAMYVSHDSAAGAPIEADVIIRKADGHIDKDYAGLSNFGYVNAQNLNAFDFDDDVEGIFITYRQADLEGNYARLPYLLDLRLFSDKDAEKCEQELKNQNYIKYEVNLTPNSDYTTYLGYKTTSDETKALTDIRIAYGYNTKQYTTGGSGSSYGNSGSTGDGKLTLYVTSISMFGTPIRSDFLVLKDRRAPAGYEPVNLFSGGPAVNLNLDDGEFISSNQEFYLYFLPSETYTSGTSYLGGLTIAYDTPANPNRQFSIIRSLNNLGYNILYTSTGNENSEAAILYTTTHNPYRAIYNITAANSGGDMGSAFSQTLVYDGIGYSIMDRFTINGQEKVAYESTAKRNGDARLYVAGIYTGGSPMTVWQLYASSDMNVPDGARPVSARLSDDVSPVNLAGGLTFAVTKYNTSAGGMMIPTVVTVKINPFYLFIRGSEIVEGDYVTNIYLTSKEEVLNLSDLDMDCDDLDNAYVVNHIASLGAHNAFMKNLNLADGDNATFLGYTKQPDSGEASSTKAITDIVLYYAGDTDEQPKSDILINGIKYSIVSKTNLFCKEDGTEKKCKRVYLYYTTNRAAGSPILDIKLDNTPILNGWETVRTQNEKALYDDMDAYSGNMWFIHVKRNVEEPKYVSEIILGIGGNSASAKAKLLAAGCDYMIDKDLNDGVGIHSHYIYLGYKKTNDPSEAIRDLRTTHDKEVDNFTKNGAFYTKIEGNLNSFTHYFADNIFLYYSKDECAGSPIISLETSSSSGSWTYGDGGRYIVKTVLNQHDKASDFNDNCGYQSDYIYLLMTRDKEDSNTTASMIGTGSWIVIVALALISLGAIVYVIVMEKKRRTKVSANDVPMAEIIDESPKEEKQND